MPFKFEKLDIWKMAVSFADDVHQLTATFPKHELFGITSQFNRASDSVSLNIAEGSIGQSDPEQKRFIGYSIRSIAECVNCLYLCRTRHYIDESQFSSYYAKAELLFIKVYKFKNAIR